MWPFCKRCLLQCLAVRSSVLQIRFFLWRWVGAVRAARVQRRTTYLCLVICGLVLVVA